MLLALLLMALRGWLRRGAAEFNPVLQLGRPVMFAGLAVLAYGGRSWARKALAVWCCSLALAFAVIAMRIGFASVPWTLVHLAFSAAAVYAARLLFTSDSIDAFVFAQRVREVGGGLRLSVSPNESPQAE